MEPVKRRGRPQARQRLEPVSTALPPEVYLHACRLARASGVTVAAVLRGVIVRHFVTVPARSDDRDTRHVRCVPERTTGIP
jgi:hypothetical protein